MLNSQIRLGDALPAEHLARFIVDVVAQLDLGLITGSTASWAHPLRNGN